MGFSFKAIGEYKKEGDLKDSPPLNLPQQEDPKEAPSLNLTKEELEYLLRYIGDGTFKGCEVEQMFYLILKLQQMYLRL